MAGYTNKYNVYGHPRNKRGQYKEEQYLGYVLDSCNQFAREQARTTFPTYVITSVTKYVGAFANPNFS